MTPDESAADMRALNDADLEFILSTESPTNHQAIAARAELSRRNRRRKFWLILVSIVLMLSVIETVISFYAGKL